MEERGRSSDSGLPLPPPSRPAGQWQFGGRASPLTAAGPSRTRTGFPHRAPWCARAYHRGGVCTLRLWLPVVAWAALIFALSSVPDLGTGLGGWDLVLRKLAHAAEYAVLGALLARATGRPRLAFALGGALRDHATSCTSSPCRAGTGRRWTSRSTRWASLIGVTLWRYAPRRLA